MNTRLLVDFIVRQTTVLVAQLSTAAGIRAPLAHVADEVFLSLSREIEAQGVGRKVAADMFGLAIRAYQKKVQRLSGSSTVHERTLWEAVLDFVTERGSTTRDALLERFARDGEREVIAVVNDLVGSGLVHVTGRGTSAIYGPTTDAERRAIAESNDLDSTAAVAWVALRAEPGITTATLAASLHLTIEAARAAVDRLAADGRARRDGEGDEAPLHAAPLIIPVGSEMGWEAAVLDHFRAVCNAIASKLRTNRTRSADDDFTGGTTLCFELTPEHPLRDRALGSLARARADAIALWRDIEAYNAEHPIPEARLERAWFYVGQYLDLPSSDESTP